MGNQAGWTLITPAAKRLRPSSGDASLFVFDAKGKPSLVCEFLGANKQTWDHGITYKKDTCYAIGFKAGTLNQRRDMMFELEFKTRDSSESKEQTGITLRLIAWRKAKVLGIKSMDLHGGFLYPITSGNDIKFTNKFITDPESKDLPPLGQ